MKSFLFFVFGFFALAPCMAQIINPVKWSAKVDKITDTEYNLVMNGIIDSGWHLYSQFTPENGPLPAEFKFENSKANYELVGKIKESPYKKQYNDVFEVDEYYFEKNVTFTQKVKVSNSKLTSIKAMIDYQVCKEVCINQDFTFTFTLPEIKEVKTSATVVKVDSLKNDTVQTTIKSSETVKLEATKKKPDSSLLTIFLLAFLGGFAALLTPCVFPMIPMTVSFFTKQSKNPAQGKRNAILYGI